MTAAAESAKGSRVSPKLYIIVGLILAAIPIGGYLYIRQRDAKIEQPRRADLARKLTPAERRRKTEAAKRCFTRPERAYVKGATSWFPDAVTSDGRTLLDWNSMPHPSTSNPTGGHEIEVQQRDLETGRLLREVACPCDPKDRVELATLVPDAQRILIVLQTLGEFTAGTRSCGYIVYAWDIPNGTKAEPLAVGEGQTAALSADGRRALFGQSDGSLRLWDLKQGRELRRFPRPIPSPEEQARAAAASPFSRACISELGFSPDGRSALTVEIGGAVHLWDLESGRLKLRLPDAGSGFTFIPATGVWARRSTGSSSSNSTALAFLPDGRQALIATHRGEVVSTDEGTNLIVETVRSIRFWDLAAGTVTREMERVEGRIGALVISPDGRRVLAHGSAYGVEREYCSTAMMWLWDLASGRLLGRFEFPRDEKSHSGHVTQALFAPDGRGILSCGVRHSRDCRLLGAEMLLWRLPDALGFRLLGTEDGGEEE